MRSLSVLLPEGEEKESARSVQPRMPVSPTERA